MDLNQNLSFTFDLAYFEQKAKLSPAAWNYALEVHPQYRDMTGIDLSHLHLSTPYNLSGLNLYQANLDGSFLIYNDIYCTNLNEATIRGTDATSLTLSRVELKRSNWNQSTLQKAYLRKVDATGATFKDVNMRYSIIKNCNFSGADLSGVDLRNATISRTDFTNTILAPLSQREIVTINKRQYALFDFRGYVLCLDDEGVHAGCRNFKYVTDALDHWTNGYIHPRIGQMYCQYIKAMWHNQA